jgi:hypothetical protein
MSATALAEKIAALPATEQKKVEIFVDELMAQSTTVQLEDPFFAELDAFRAEIKAEYGTFPGALRHLRELRDGRG